MPSTYSPSLRIELIGDGEQDAIWGQTTNNNLGGLIEQAIAGVTTVNVTAADVTLTSFNGTADEARSAVLVVNGSNAVTRNVVIPNATKTYIVRNNTSQTVGIKTTSGSAYNCLTGTQALVYCDGANGVFGVNTNTGVGAGAFSTLSATSTVSGAGFTALFASPPAIGGTAAAAGTFTSMACSSASITSSAPTLSLIDTDGQDFSVHVNSNIWYVLNQGGSGIIYTDQSGNFTAAGNVTAFSDERLKSNIKTLPAALDTVDQLRGVSFIKDGKANIGVIAQEVQRVLPQVVQENADGYLSVAYGNLVGVLIEAVKELRAEIKALKGE